MASGERPLPFVSEDNLALCTDLYQLTMAAGYFENRLDQVATFELFVRTLPPHRAFLVAAGLEQALQYIERLRFNNDAIDYLRRHDVFTHMSDEFFDYLKGFRFTGDVHAMPEGTVFFSNEPVLRVTAPVIEAQVVETYLLTTINFQTLVATKAARVVQAAQGRLVADFGTRRAHGPLAGLWAARASYIGGCTSTSNVLAGAMFGIPVVGTAAHSWTMAFDTEEEAYRRYHDVFPDSTVLLIDTYDTIEGARRAARLDFPIRGVRLDSGDLAALSREVRKILDDAGKRDVKIIASGDLNEYKIAELLAKDAPIDLFGVGTEMVTSKDAPALGGVYKLVEQRSGNKVAYKMKASEDKATYPSAKQVFRQADANGMFVRDVLTTADDAQKGAALIEPAVEEGKRSSPPLPLDVIRDRAQEQIACLGDRFRALAPRDAYPVEVSDRLRKLTRRTREELGIQD
ncbi:MAG: nicotinate phosphoribosyltransferase [Planctomycetes bacterium]|nr:nicotinate phosphoribosyltransferase [Planctomycetota bacterium]